MKFLSSIFFGPNGRILTKIFSIPSATSSETEKRAGDLSKLAIPSAIYRGLMKIKKNIGTFGRILRFAIATLLLALAYVKSSWFLAAFGVFVLFESLASWCIVYHFLGKSS